MSTGNLIGRFAADAVGLSDLGKIVPPNQYSSVLGDNYIMQEDDEKIYFVIKSKSDEYVFTNYALIHVDGESAVSRRKAIHRYEFMLNKISSVILETAGSVDIDIELKFIIGSKEFDLEVNRKDLEGIKDLYKSLVEISNLQYKHDIENAEAKEALNFASTCISNSKGTEINVDLVKSITNFNYKWLRNFSLCTLNKDFGEVFEKYINE